MLKPWKCEGMAKDGRVSASGKHEPFENFGENCAMCTLPREEVVGSSPSSSGKGVAIAAVIGVLAALGLGSWLFLKPNKPCPTGQQTVNGVCQAFNPAPDPSNPADSPVIPVSPPSLTVAVSLIDRSSTGEKVLFTFSGNPERDRGAEAFARGDYDKAIQLFQKAVNSSPNDPESQIYLNNAKAQKQGNPYILAAVVPIRNKSTSAEEILRGIAEAQTMFDESGNTRLVEIMLVDDGNDPDTASTLASQIAAKSEVLGVIGHNASDASAAALPVYEAAGLAMISPTSTSTKLKGNAFFRTVPSDADSGKVLAEYMATQNLQKVAVFYEPKNNYSESLLSAFKENFTGKVVQEFDLNDIEPDKAVNESAKQQADAPA